VIERTYTITGQITIHDPSEITKVELMQNGEVKYTITIEPEPGSEQVTKQFTISDVVPGTYDIVVSEPGHQSYTVTGIDVTGDVDLTQSGDENSSIILNAMGDANLDTNDVVAILRFVVGYAATNFYAETADINGDGNVDTNDAVSIMRKVVE